MEKGILFALTVALIVSVGEAQCSTNPPAVVNAYWNCGGTSVGSTCTARCKTGYTSPPFPTSICMGNNTWSTPTGRCHKVCTTPPDPALLGGLGSWPAICDNGTVVATRCYGTCSGTAQGSPSIQCGGVTFESSTLTGRCVDGPICGGNPTARLVNGRWPTSCMDTPVGLNCTGICNANYGGPIPPTVQCGAQGWETTATGSCVSVCPGPPPADLLSDGVWPETCNGKTPHGQFCSAVCNNYGDATIRCNGIGWDRTSFIGKCSTDPVCTGRPPNVLNGRFLATCSGTGIGKTCEATCNTGYIADGKPTSVCTLDEEGNAVWSNPSPGACVRGTVMNGVAFIADIDNSEVIICTLTAGKFSNCAASNGAVGAAKDEPLQSPRGLAVWGNQLYVTEQLPISRIRACTWSGRQLLWCQTSDMTGPWSGGGQVVVEPQRGLLFTTADINAYILICPLTDISSCTAWNIPGLESSYPSGLAIAYDSLWISSSAGISRCPLTADGFAYDQCTTKLIVDANNNTGAAYGIIVDSSGPGTIYAGDPEKGCVWVCDINLSVCASSLGNGTFTTPGGANQSPGYGGLAIDGGLLYVPLQLVPVSALSVCNRPETASGCTLSFWNLNPPRELNGSANIVIVPSS